MATILIVEDDGLVSRQMASIIRSAGHSPVLAQDARSAVREASLGPELVLLDLGLPDLPGEELLDHLLRMPETAHAPVVVVTGMTDRAARLRERKPPGLADILLKPVNDTQLSRAVRTALATPQGTPAQRLPTAEKVIWRNAVFRIIAQGPDRLARHVYRRLCADRTQMARLGNPRPLEWPEIAKWALLDGLVDEAEARLIRETPAAPSPIEVGDGSEPPGSAREPATGQGAARQAAS